MKVPFLDLNRMNAPYKKQLQEAFDSVLDSGQYILGQKVDSFENAFAQYCGTKYCIGTGNGLDALTILLKGYVELGKLKEGDKIIVAANTFIATILSIKHAGLEPVLVEPDEKTYTICPDRISEALTTDTKAIVVTHLYGQLADMEKIRQITSQNNLILIDDAAQAHGAVNQVGEKAGNLADATIFSFYPTKNLGCLGDGGAITTNNSILAMIIQKLRNYGKVNKYEHELVGYNTRLDELQAAFLSEKLTDLDNTNALRRQIANTYIYGIHNDLVKTPFWDGSYNHVFHLFVVRVQQREKFCKYLEDNHIGCLIHYPVAPHQQKAPLVNQKDRFKITEKITEEVVSLPMFPGLTVEEIQYVIQKINKWRS
ncbi:DegT/DnrJ/EryC1/StrS family aminotransferase [Aquimarina sp. SS2-1]|uniref:DegT/DnrJ/EryC1/StrS family aminotransferase n=1 Tax=Aquimarina besae TaxID=3342247 RepID=UPI003672C51F